MDETYIRVKGEWKYLYRAVDKDGNTIDFLLRAHRDKTAARRYFEKSIAQNGVTGDGDHRQKRRQSRRARSHQCRP
jgi:transposase-like protein